MLEKCKQYREENKSSVNDNTLDSYDLDEKIATLEEILYAKWSSAWYSDYT